MENQINTGDKNTQQIGQNPINQSIPITKKSKVNYWMILSVVLAVGLVLVSGLHTLSLKNTSNSNNQQITQPNSITPTGKAIQASPASPVTQEAVTTPVKNTLYLGIYNGADAIFLTDEEKQKYFDPDAVPRTNPYIGELQMAGGGGYTLFDFKELQSPKRIFSSSQKIHSVNSFKLNNSKGVAYVSLNYDAKVNSQYPGLVNKIIQIKLDTLVSSEIWSNEVGSNKYEGGKGVAYIETVTEDRFLTFWIGSCYACEGGPAGTVILNIDTKKEKYFKDIGNIQFNITNNTFSYQKLALFQEPCDPGPGCDNGQRTVMKPAGQSYTENLP